jgi:hypothetical protein
MPMSQFERERTFLQLKGKAERLVEQVQSVDPDVALPLVLESFLDVRREATSKLMTEVEQAIAAVLGAL